MARKSITFSDTLLRGLVTALEQHPDGVTLPVLEGRFTTHRETLRKALKIVGTMTWSGNNKAPAEYLLHPEADARIREHLGTADTPAQEPPVVSDDGVCYNCNCSPSPDMFAMVDGRARLLACPRMAPPSPMVHRARLHAVTGPVLRSEIPVQAAELTRRRVLRAVRNSEAPLSEHELQSVTLLKLPALQQALGELHAAGQVTQLTRVRPGAPAVMLWAMASQASATAVVRP